MRATFYQLVVLSLGFIAIAAPLGDIDYSIVRATDGDEYVRWPDNSIDENGLLVAAYEDSNTT
ncbi:ce39e72d-e327-4af7-bd47-54c0ed1f8dfe [Sclerotinia trifoliorum]|uniref:Ce39e72d-e327-4af7-bd47-54c0ed1f8dfe n=1 Tax=Sclerotinia trifoliorum TaxID=28548 RepID=A0A8H2W6L8_9HELO|nr:ce39e72d-e327-4af7-bd47-54c0ed1f8dfe [Sclerotinia trifoliorum]